jgi:hypothetical protein
MAINFPDAPAQGQRFTDATSGNSWIWDGVGWTGDGGGGGSAPDLSGYVLKTGDTMSGTLAIDAASLLVGGTLPASPNVSINSEGDVTAKAVTFVGDTHATHSVMRDLKGLTVDRYGFQAASIAADQRGVLDLIASQSAVANKTALTVRKADETRFRVSVEGDTYWGIGDHIGNIGQPNVVVYNSGGIAFGANATNPGVRFPAVSIPSNDPNTLYDYEVGTFVPTIVGLTTAGVGTYTAQSGRYTKIGNRVMIQITVTWSAHTGTGNMRVAGLPFAVTNIAEVQAPLALTASGVTFNGIMCAFTINNSSQVYLRNYANGGPEGDIAFDTAGSLRLGGVYEAV